MTTARCAVLGSPIAHSLSPLLHRAAYAELGLDWSYERVEVGEAQLAEFLERLDHHWRGLSLTMPLKRAVLPLLDELSGRVRATGAANTVVLTDGRRLGENTDVPGAVAAIRERYDGPVRSAVIVGAGATAGSLLAALAELGCEEVTVLARDPERARATLTRAPGVGVTFQPLAGPPVRGDLVASTVPASAQSADIVARTAQIPVLFEVVYAAGSTPLVAALPGRTVIGALDLLVHQAALQVPLMTGLGDPETLVPVMRAALDREVRS